MASDPFRTCFIVNPASANGATGRHWSEMESVLRRHLPAMEVRMTTGPRHAGALVGEALGEGFEMIVAVGGDGTNNEVVNGFFDGEDPINPRAVMGTLPRGTGGDFRKTFGWGLDLDESARRLATRDTRTIDLGHMSCLGHSGQTEHYWFINISSFGIGGEVVAEVNRASKALGGKFSFLKASIKVGLRYKNRRVRMRLDGEDLGEQKIYIVAACNGQFFGGGMQIAPTAVPDDGLFDVITIGDFTLMESLGFSRHIYKGAHLGRPKIERRLGKVLEAESDETVLIDLDGEQPGRLPARWEIRPAALRLKV